MNPRTIEFCRAYLGIPADVPDEQVVAACRGSMAHAIGDLAIAVMDLKAAFAKSLPWGRK